MSGIQPKGAEKITCFMGVTEGVTTYYTVTYYHHGSESVSALGPTFYYAQAKAERMLPTSGRSRQATVAVGSETYNLAFGR